MKFGHFCAAMVAVALLASCTTPQPQKQTDLKHLRIATEGNFSPFNFVAADGSLQGFDVDIAKALCAKMQADCTIVRQQWDGMIPELMRGKYDAIIASMSITEERKQVIDFSDPYYITPAMLVALKDSKLSSLGSDGNPSPQSIKGLFIGVLAGSPRALYARTHFYSSGAALKVYATIEEADAALVSGQVDAIFEDGFFVEYGVLKAAGGDRFSTFGKGYLDSQLDNRVGIGVRKQDTALRDNFNTALKAIYADGTYQKINAKYFSFDLYPKPLP